MAKILYAAITSFVVSLALIPFIIRFSKKKKIFDAPGKRRIHKRITPSLGGIAIFAGFTLSCLVWLSFSQLSLKYFLLVVLIIPFIMGVVDDLAHLKPIAKIAGQTITAALIFFVLDVRINYGFGLVDQLPLTLSFLATTGVIILLPNSFNLIDGIDGLAAFFSITCFSVFGIWFFLVDDQLNAFFCLTLVGGITAFLFRNWEPSQIFMGDTGSLVVGTMLAYAAIEFLNNNERLPIDAAWKFQPRIGAVVAALIIPIADTSRIIIIRISKGISLFKADKNHIHHALVRLGFTHRQAVSLLALIHICFLLLATSLQHTSDVVMVPIIIAIVFALCMVLNFFLVKKRRYEKVAKIGDHDYH